MGGETRREAKGKFVPEINKGENVNALNLFSIFILNLHNLFLMLVCLGVCDMSTHAILILQTVNNSLE